MSYVPKGRDRTEWSASLRLCVHLFSRTATGGRHSIADILVLLGFTLGYSNFVFGCIVDCVIVESVVYICQPGFVFFSFFLLFFLCFRSTGC